MRTSDLKFEARKASGSGLRQRLAAWGVRHKCASFAEVWARLHGAGLRQSYQMMMMWADGVNRPGRDASLVLINEGVVDAAFFLRKA